MKKIILFYLLILQGIFSFGQAVITNPSPFEVDQPVTITIDENTTATDCNHLNNPNKVYMHAGVGDETQPWRYVVGNWGQDDGVGEMTDNGDGTWSITIVPKTYFGLTDAQAATITRMGLVFRNEDGTQEYKDNGCRDFILPVGAFQVTLINPDDSKIILVNQGDGTQILAQNTNGPADYQLYANGTLIHTQTGTDFYNGYLFQNLQENQFCELVVTQNGHQITIPFVILVNRTVQATLPQGMEDGINIDPNDPTRATLVLTAPYKDFVYVAGSFNNWQPNSTYAMKKDPSSEKYWVELTGLTPGTDYTFQYWVADMNPIQDSPKLVKTADPYSTLVLSPFDDPYIPSTSYPNLPPYPQGQEREVTVLNTQPATYQWQVTQFTKPKKEDLVIYEVLIRDFDANRTYQDLINRIDYFKNLRINAIQLMPVMEFEGNEGWGYNPAFHLANDKFYGPANKLKEFIDLCHQNGIAVILDLAINHVMGRNPLVRMWMNDPDGDGWGPPSSENPYLNEHARHAYGIGYDFNHQSDYTKYYTKRVIKYWIEEFKIDGFRWDLTKGFTQNCNEGDETCTNSYQQDRVDILKYYADYAWSLDPDHYVIFEHLGNTQEETEWANYRINEGKGIMLWANLNQPYNELTMGWTGNRDFSWMGHTAHGFQGKRALGYAESHDEERLMYRNITYGNNTNASHNVRDLNTALYRMRALGAVSLLIPGPKMIWHFGDLGMEQSLYTCTDGSVDPNCRLATKPQPQWQQNWLNVPERRAIYDDWSRMIAMKIQDPVFEGDYTIQSGDFTPHIYIWDNTIPSSQLKNVIVVANFDVVSRQVTPNFPYTGTWYDLMNGNPLSVTQTNMSITLQPGEYKIYGNQLSTVSVKNHALPEENVTLYPNPAGDYFMLDKDAKHVEIFDVTGKKVLESLPSGKEKGKFDIQGLKPGVYNVKIETGDGFYMKKLIKNL